jgi:DNA-binding MarR family transcriptional regulator
MEEIVQRYSTIFNPHYNSINSASKIVVAFERIAEAFRVMLWQAAKNTGLSPLQIQILTFLSFHPPEQRKISYLAAEFNMSKPTVSDAVKTLEEKGLITKETEEHDTRSYIISVSAAGEQTAREASAFAERFTRILSGMPPIEQDALLEQLLGVVHSLHKERLLSMQRACFSCIHYKADAFRSAGSDDAFCALLDQRLPLADIRLDCPYHEEES